MSDLVFESETYSLSPLSEKDITSQWGSWLNQKEIADFLNIGTRYFSSDELRDYLGRFDQDKRLLLGIFHKPSKDHIGIFSSIQSDRGREVLLNLLIGEIKYHASGAGLLEHRKLYLDLLDYFFFKRKYIAAYASVLAENKKVIAIFNAYRWEVVRQTYVENNRSPGSEPLEVELLRMTVNRYLETRVRFCGH